MKKMYGYLFAGMVGTIMGYEAHMYLKNCKIKKQLKNTSNKKVAII